MRLVAIVLVVTGMAACNNRVFVTEPEEIPFGVVVAPKNIEPSVTIRRVDVAPSNYKLFYKHEPEMLYFKPGRYTVWGRCEWTVDGHPDGDPVVLDIRAGDRFSLRCPKGIVFAVNEADGI